MNREGVTFPWGTLMSFPRLTSTEPFIQRNLEIGYLKADLEEIRQEWLKRTKHLALEFREPIRLRDRT